MRNDEKAINKSKNTAKGFCEICKIETNNLSNHVKYKHVRSGEIESLQEYYHKHIICSDIKPICLNCGKEVEFISVNKGYKRTCSHLCSMNAEEIKHVVQTKAKEGVKKKYGVENISQVQEVKDKKKETFQKHYGKDHIWCNKEGEIRSCEIIMLEKYGVKSPLQNEEIKQKVFLTNIKRYGFKSPSKNEEVKNKVKQTFVDKYNGFAFQKDSLLYPNFIEKINQNGGFTLQRESFRQTMIERYGFKYPMQNRNVMEKSKKTRIETYGSQNNIKKIQETLLEKYGVTNVSHIPEFFEKAQMNNTVGKKKEYIKNIEGKEVGCSSFLEQRFVHYCNSKNIVVERGDCIEYCDFDKGKDRRYHCDFKIRESDNRWRLVELKGDHKWWKQDLENGKALLKINAAKEFSVRNNYHEFLIILSNQLKKRYISAQTNNYDENISNSFLTKENTIDSILFKKESYLEVDLNI